MRAYELMVIIDGDLDADQAQAQVSSIEGRCNEAGMVASTDFWGRRTFAYEINHKTEGSYVVYEILAEPGALDGVERSLRLADEIVRHKLLRLPDAEAERRGLMGSAAADQ
ncbi:MAG: 30S ribosomal protein S6 [Acidimicrobiia bacterium]|jgi:small subunit ribosomal protein S6